MKKRFLTLYSKRGFELLLQGMPCHDGNIAAEKRK